MATGIVKGGLAAFTAPIFFALISITLNLFPPGDSLTALHFLRPFVAALLLLPIVYLTEPKSLKPKKKDIRAYALIGFALAITIQTYNTAVVSAPVGTIVLLTQFFAVISVLVFSFFLLKEKVTHRELAALFVALIGIFVVNPLDPSCSFGAVLVLISSITYGIAMIIIRNEGHKHGVGICFWYLLFASAFLFPSAVVSGFDVLTNAFGLVILLGFVNAGAYAIKTYALKYETADLVQIIEFVVEPMVTLSFGLLILNQTPSVNVLIGGFLAVLGMLIISKEIFFHGAPHPSPNKKLAGVGR